MLAGRRFGSTAALDAAFAAWLPIRRAQVHRTNGEVIGVRAERDRAALRPLPAAPYQVLDRHLRRVGKDCLVSFQSARYSLPAVEVRAGMIVELRVGPDRVAIHATGGDPRELASHRRAGFRGDDQIDPTHWDGLPDGTGRATVLEVAGDVTGSPRGGELGAGLAVVLAHRAKLATRVARRDPALYDAAAGLAAATGR